MARRRRQQPNLASDADDTTPGVQFIDREPESALLQDRLTTVASGGGGGVVLLRGESGVGKSRLVSEILREAASRDLQKFWVHCVGQGAEPLLPFKEALATHIGRSPEAIRRVLIGSAPKLLELIPFVGAFLAKVGESIVSGPQLGGASVHGLYEGLARVILGLTERRGLFLVVEDLQAADQDTLYFLNYLLGKVMTVRIFLLLTIQDEALAAGPLSDLLDQWTSQGHTVVRMLPLEKRFVAEYVGRVWEGDVDTVLVDRLYRLTAGNPFFLSETVQLILEEGEANAGGEDGALEDIPPKTKAVLHRRLASANAETREFLDAAAVLLQTTQELEPLAYIMNIDESRAIRLLTQACELNLMVERSEGGIDFVHDLMHREVYSALGTNYRRYTHRRTAEWLDKAGQYASAAFHYEQAGRISELIVSALRSAEVAEHMGMFPSALAMYEKVRPHVEIREIGTRLGRALIVLGRWREAESLLDSLPADDPEVWLLRSELRFVLGDFTGAAEQARRALTAGQTARFAALLRLADTHLYLGEFDRATDYARQAVDLISATGSVAERARCMLVLGATLFFGGEVDAGEQQYLQALNLLRSCPEEQRDRTIYAVVLGNLGVARELHKDWAAAQRYHTEALQLRREVFDARGMLHSLHAVGRTCIQLGDEQAALAHLAEGSQLAADLGETLEGAKITHSRGEIAAREGQFDIAIRYTAEALKAFEKAGTSFDIAHARFSLSDLYEKAGQERTSIEFGAAARAAAERKGFGLLRRMFPHLAFTQRDRIGGALMAYACGDAFGLPWEGLPPSGIDPEQAERLPNRQDWPRGATSDDTALTFLVARYLIENGTQANAHAFAELLSARADSIRGLGPSTTQAIEHFRSTGRLATTGGNTNGAAMRALPIGWATPLDAVEARRALTIDLSRVTHPGREAQAAACIAAACGSWALEGASTQVLLRIAIEESQAAARACGADDRIIQMLRDLAAERWAPPSEGVDLDPYATVVAALYCLMTTSSLPTTLRRAVEIGGDTDTVGALAGGLRGAQHTADEVRAALPWSGLVVLPPKESIEELAAGLAMVRLGGTND